MEPEKRDENRESEFDELTGRIIGCAIKVHKVLGPGLLESAYETCLAHELRKSGLRVETQLPVPVVYDGVRLDAGYRLDLLVEDTIIVDTKACEKLIPIHEAQLLTYLRLAGKPIGLILNFHTTVLTQGIKRMRL